MPVNKETAVCLYTVETQNTVTPWDWMKSLVFWDVRFFPGEFKEANLKAKKEEEKSGPIQMFGFLRILVFWVSDILSFHCIWNNDTLCNIFSAICDAGKYFSSSTCIPCERGTYKENVGDARFGNCTDCSNDKTTESVGADKESLCSLRKFCWHVLSKSN